MANVLTRSKVKSMTDVKDDPDKPNTTGIWTNEDKELFLKAVKLHSIHNIDEICGMVPNHSKKDIKDFIKCQVRQHKQYKLVNVVNLADGPVKCLRLSKDVEKNAVELWLDILCKTRLFPPKHFNELCFFMKLMSDFGKHQNTVNENNIDFQRLYLYMSHTLQGMKPCRINEITEHFIRGCLEELAVEHRDENRFEKEQMFLKNLPDTFFNRIESNDNFEEQSLLEAAEIICYSKTLNPLNVPLELIKVD